MEIKIIHHAQEMHAFSNEQLKKNKSIGFVPTMGALHPGHLSLIEKAKSENGIVVCSIFVNPTQFNDPKDLENYPRMPEADVALLKSAGCDLVFLPTPIEIYPNGLQLLDISFGYMEETMEGPSDQAILKELQLLLTDYLKLFNLPVLTSEKRFSATSHRSKNGIYAKSFHRNYWLSYFTGIRWTCHELTQPIAYC